ncbi:hypothetical protein SCLARK_001566 [Spiroplasma clarkii]|nr:hypothetical protein SCLARK_001566 [Spiroplasma clarkii]
MGLLTWLAIVVASKNKVDANPLTANEKTLIIFCFIFAFLAFSLLTTNIVLLFIYDLNVFNIKVVILAVITLNIELLVYLVINWAEVFRTIRWSKPQKWSIFDITTMGLLLGIYLIIDYVSSFVPVMPFWITPSFKYVVLFFAAYILTFSCTFSLCIIIGFITIIMPGTAVMSPVQYIFDYFVPIMAFSLASFFRPIEKIDNKVVQILQWNLYVFVPMLIVYLSRVISGIAFWLNPAVYDGVSYEFNWNGAFTYSLIFNAFNSIVDYFVLVILTPMICIPLTVIKHKQEINRQQ